MHTNWTKQSCWSNTTAPTAQCLVAGSSPNLRSVMQVHRTYKLAHRHWPLCRALWNAARNLHSPSVCPHIWTRFPLSWNVNKRTKYQGCGPLRRSRVLCSNLPAAKAKNRVWIRYFQSPCFRTMNGDWWIQSKDCPTKHTALHLWRSPSNCENLLHFRPGRWSS